MGKTKIIPKQLFENRNTSDVFPRLIIMGLLKILNQKLTYQQVWQDNAEGIQNVTVPFFFDFSASTASERFIQDNYMHWTDEECSAIGMKKVDGDFKSLPYGVLSLESSSIESGSITNRFVMGRFNKKVDGQLKSYVSFLYSIPLTMNFNVNIKCESVNTMWKIEQAYREYFYKNKTFRVNYRGAVVPCRVGFPESLASTKTNTYTMGQATDTDIKLSFSLACETYYPVFDPETERPAENTINFTSSNIMMKNSIDEERPKGDLIGTIKPLTYLDNMSIMTNEDVLLQWTYDYLRTDLLNVDIMYKEKGDDTLMLIETVENHDCYHLQIQDDFVEDPVQIDVIILTNDDCVIVNTPILKAFPDPDDKIISESTIRVVDKGFVITQRPYIDAVLSYQFKDNYVEHPIRINITNNMVDTEHPVTMEKGAVYSNDINYKSIKLFLRDHNNPEIITPLQSDDAWIKVF